MKILKSIFFTSLVFNEVIGGIYGTIGQRNKPLNPSTKYVEEISILRMESIYIVYGFFYLTCFGNIYYSEFKNFLGYLREKQTFFNL